MWWLVSHDRSKQSSKTKELLKCALKSPHLQWVNLYQVRSLLSPTLRLVLQVSGTFCDKLLLAIKTIIFIVASDFETITDLELVFNDSIRVVCIRVGIFGVEDGDKDFTIQLEIGASSANVVLELQEVTVTIIGLLVWNV